MDQPERAAVPSNDIATGVGNVVDAALGLGVSLARVVAEATALGRPVEPVAAGTPALTAIVRYGATAAGNVVGALVSSVQGVKPSVGAARRPAPAAAKAAGPRVAPGATLRVPLSVENPSDRPMANLSPRLRAVRRGGADAGALLPAGCVHFSPAAFEVAAHDFEKLTVMVSVPAETPAGDYEVVFALGDDEPDLKMAFAVVAC
jgi:hypothetical protein